MLPFLLLGSGAGVLAYMMEKRGVAAALLETKKAEAETKVAPAEEPISASLKIDDLKIELGYSLLPLVNSPDGTNRWTARSSARIPIHEALRKAVSC